MCCLLYAFVARAQAPVANFSASVTSGCSPVVVSFKDLSTGNPKFWNWDLGNGQLSNQQNPAAIYVNPGTYSVTLVVRNADGTDGITKTNLIVVNPSPQADFTVNLNTVCTPAVVNFTDVSVANAGTITKWEWDFGDGTTSSAQNPTKKFSSIGYYTITLKVTSSTGCVNTNSKGRFIRVVSGVKAAFIDSISPVCRTPVDVKFINETSGPGDLSYAWNFGNGSQSNATDPVQTYGSAGTYNIRLIANSSLGCSDTVEKSVVVNNKLTSFAAPDSACIDQAVNFTNGATTAISSIWKFGDDSTANGRSAVKKYSVPGEYVVKLVNTYADCVDSAEKRITVVDLPTVAFTSDKQISCKAPFTVNFQDNTANAVTWSWDFGDGNKGSGRTASHTYTAPGQFDVTLTVTSKFGCQNTLKQTAFIKIIPPTVAITNAPAGGCIPFTFSPVAAVNAIDGVATYSWNFGNGVVSSGTNPSAIYSSVGNYDISLTITTVGGCAVSTNIPSGVRTGTPPTLVNFSSDKSVTCAFGEVQFTDLSTSVNEWLWDFGDGKTSTDKNPKHVYDSVGDFTVKLTGFNNGCAGPIKTTVITVTPPIARFTYQRDCNNGLSVNFVNASVIDINSPVTYKWEFGDPANNTSDQPNPVFKYPAIGKYTVKLTVINGSCTNTITKEITLVAELANFSATKTTVCKNEKLTFTAIGSNPDNISSYVWSVNGTQLPIGSSFETFFPLTGSYDIGLTITDINGCTDTNLKNGFIAVTGPLAALNASTDSSCVNSTITFSDATTPAGNINKWTFNFGDGTSQTFSSAPFTYAFKDTGTYQITLSVEDKQGCTDITSPTPIFISRAIAGFGADQTKICPEIPVQFTDSSSGYGLSYMWSFGDLAISDLKHPSHAYTLLDKKYTVKLKVTDASGCSDSLTRVDYIDVRTPKAAFDIRDTVSICPPLETSFFFKGADYESYFWDFGDGGTSMLENPTHFYNSYGSFPAKLYVIGFGGCMDSAAHPVNVYNPYNSSLKYTPLDACNTLLVDFDITTPPGTKFQLIFGDGGSDVSQQKKLQHQYNSPSFYQPYIVLEDSMDCEVSVYQPDVIKILGAEPFFSMDRKSACDSATIYFTNFTIGNDRVISDTWDFGDGATSSVKDPVHTYNRPGTYVVSHIVQTESGCGKTITDTVRIYRTPDPSITSKDVICINTPELIEGILAVPDTAIKWTWTFGDGQTATSQNHHLTYTRDGNFTINVEAANLLGCKAAASKTVSVTPLPQINVAENPVISGGSSVKLPVTYSQSIMTYNWSPESTLDCHDCPNPVAKPKFSTTYKINVVDSNNCKQEAEILVTVVCNDKNFFLPNTFSPNGDGVNDYFYPRGSSIDKIQSMRIFNRWGELVFEKRNFAVNSQSDGWNGTFKGKPANGDVYVYIIEFVCENATVLSSRGNVALIR
jgi:gliding motility-associated-like protein